MLQNEMLTLEWFKTLQALVSMEVISRVKYYKANVISNCTCIYFGYFAVLLSIKDISSI